MPTLARDSIDADADKVVRRLARRGHKAYLVGGCVRDLLLERTPKDFDVATSATPNEIKQLFRNCRIIGRRFRLAHIFFGPKIIETSTFRANPRDGESEDSPSELLIRRDNVFGTDTDDARRRDFTINGLFYDVETEQVIDHVGGMEDLEARLVRTIGDPEIRFREDPVRMLRAIKFAARLNFRIEPRTYTALMRHRMEITKCAPPRVLEEVYRLLRGGAARRSMELLIETGVAAVLSPTLAALFAEDTIIGEQAPAREEKVSEEDEWLATWQDDEVPEPAHLDIEFLDTGAFEERQEIAWKVLDHLDRLRTEGEELTNALLLSALVNPFVADSLVKPGVRPTEANQIIGSIGQPLIEELRVARRDAERARQVLLAQRRLAPARRRRGRPMALIRRDYFDEALAVYEITAEANGEPDEEAARWRQLRDEDLGEVDPDDGSPRRRRRRRRGGRRRRRASKDSPDSPPAPPTTHGGEAASAMGG